MEEINYLTTTGISLQTYQSLRTDNVNPCDTALLPHHQKPTGEFWTLTIPDSCLVPYNKCFLHHNLVSVDWLYCLCVSGLEFGLVTEVSGFWFSSVLKPSDEVSYCIRDGLLRSGRNDFPESDLEEVWRGMSSCNNSIPQPLIFVLAGIPGLESSHVWFSVPFFLVFVVAVIGNATILCIIRVEKSLHEPMFLLLAMLSVVDLSLVSVTVPRMLGIFWMNAKEISFNACLTQMFFIPSFYVMESGVLLAMAFDRFVAIWHPLRYTTVLSNSLLVKMALAVLARAVAVLTPAPILVKRLESFQTHIIAYSYCAYMAVVQIACGDLSDHIVYGLMVIVASVGFDLFFIILSYGLILHAVFRIPSWEARGKAFSTCGSHLCVIALFYSPVIFSVLAQILCYRMAPHLQIIIDNLYFLVPPMINPLIYGARTKQMREWVLRIFHCEGD
ncbi:olfactory receptor 52K1-like [Bos javanicus]|uniref:olfactory receptor 52K1-like n=1 Tax=Bos javanicus TaxID=9906 RepID=UPI002AA926EA|nr:olfactory receptor 52K1-like [Bos javanicus]